MTTSASQPAISFTIFTVFPVPVQDEFVAGTGSHRRRRSGVRAVLVGGLGSNLSK